VSLTLVRQFKTHLYFYSCVDDTGLVILNSINVAAVVFFTGVVDTGEASKITNILATFSKKFKTHQPYNQGQVRT
jgi:hypothetical protein